MEYTLQDYCNRIREDVKDYDYILIGLGDEALNNNDGNLIDMLNKFGELLDKNNKFIISYTVIFIYVSSFCKIGIIYNSIYFCPCMQVFRFRSS